MSKRTIALVVIAAVGALDFGWGAFLLREKRRAPAQRPIVPVSSDQTDLEPVHVLGEAKAPVTIEEFGDFQCPACAATSAVIRNLEKDYGPRLRVVFWDFPLAMHHHSREAANAAEAAARQGHFWEMHDLLYQNQPEWTESASPRPEFEKFARKIGLDLRAFEEDVEKPEVAARVEAEHQHGVGLGVRNTPTLFINGKEIAPPFEADRLRKAIDAALAEKKSP